MGKNIQIKLDFQNSEHVDHIVSLYGGNEKFKSTLPLQHGALMKASKKVSNGTIEEENEGFFSDGLCIENVLVLKDENKLVIDGIVSLTKLASFIDMHMEVVTSADEFVAGESQMQYDTTNGKMHVEAEYNSSEFKSNQLEIKFTALWAENASNKLNGMVNTKELDESVVIDTTTANITMSNPVKKNSEMEEIVVCYGRNAYVKQHDYAYDAYVVNGKQLLMLDVSGFVVFNEDSADFEKIDIDTFELTMKSEQGIASYKLKYTDPKTGEEKDRTEAVKSAFYQLDGGFAFALDSFWGEYVPVSKKLDWSTKVSLNFELTYILTDGTKGSIQISSDLSEESNGGNKKIPQIILLWGCLAENTLVAMADGSQRKIQEINISEMVEGKFGAVKVVDMYKSTSEEAIVTIITDLNRKIGCSPSHIIACKTGDKSAGELIVGDEICDKNGAVQTVMAIDNTKTAYTYNLELEADGYFFAENMLVGDIKVQNTPPEQAKVENIYIAEKINKEELFSVFNKK